MTAPAPRARRLLLALAGLVLLFAAPMFFAPDGFVSGDLYRDNDWLTDRFYDLVARQALFEDRVFPLRSPLIGGGFPTIGHPFDGSWAPTLLAVLAFGPVVGVKVNLVLLLLLGAAGAYALGRRWLDLPPAAAAFGAAVFALSGWLPSVMLVGFWPQALYFVTPAVLACLFDERLSSRVLGGALLFLLLQQAGNGFVAVCTFLGLTLWVAGAVRSGPARGAWEPLAFLVMLTGSLALGARYGWRWLPVVAVVVAALWARRSGRMRATARRLRRPLAGLAVVLLVALTLGIGKLVPLSQVLADAKYEHVANIPPTLYPLPGIDGGPARILDRTVRSEDYYNGPLDLLRFASGRVPSPGRYKPSGLKPVSEVPVEDIDITEGTFEYGWLGLTPPLLLLALLGLGWGLRERQGRLEVAVVALGAAAVTMGPYLPPDLHFLLVSGVPMLSDLTQPLKYHAFFLLLPLALLAGRGALGVWDLARPRLGDRATAGLLAVLLLWPLVQNGAVWADRFAHPLPAWSCDGCAQVVQVGHPSWVSLPREEIDAFSDRLWLRERRRPPMAREYDNAVRGVGTVDWYGTLRLPEPAVPSHFVSRTGVVTPNPAYKGEAWVHPAGSVTSVDIGPNVVAASVTLPEDGALVFNQAYLRGFTWNGGDVGIHEGLLAVQLPAGQHDVRLVYRPPGVVPALLASGLFVLLWTAAFVTLRRRGR